MAGAESGRGQVGDERGEAGSGWITLGFAGKTTESVEQGSHGIDSHC